MLYVSDFLSNPLSIFALPKSYIFFLRPNSIRTGLPFNTSRLLLMSVKAKTLPLDENSLLYQQFYSQTLPVLMSTNAGSLFMSFHPLWAAEGAEVVLAAQGSVATCGQPGQVGQMVARDLTSLCIVACQIAKNNKLAGQCLANKSSNQYLKSRNDLDFCPKAGDFFPKKGWHTNSWCCINEWIKQQVQKQAAVNWIALKLTCFVKTEGYSARG